MESFCALLHLAASLGWDIQQLNVKTTFLYGILPDNEDLYMEQPRGFEEPGKEDWVWRLMYVAISTHPDIVLAVQNLSQFLDCYNEIHWEAAKHVIHYLEGTCNY